MPVSWSISDSSLPRQLVTPRTGRSRFDLRKLRAVVFTSNGGAAGVVITIPFAVHTRAAHLENLVVRRS